MTRDRKVAAELTALALLIAAHAVLLTRLLRGPTSFDEAGWSPSPTGMAERWATAVQCQS